MRRRSFLQGLLGLLASPLLPAAAKPKYFTFVIPTPIVAYNDGAFITEIWSESGLAAFYTEMAAESLAQRIEEDLLAIYLRDSASAS